MATKMNSRGRVSEVSTGIDLIVNAYNDSGVTVDPKIAGYFTELETKNTTLIDTLNRIKLKSVFEEKDKNLDEKIRALFYYVFGATFSHDETVKEAALAVYEIMNHHGLAILSESYTVEIAMVKAFLNDLQPEAIQAKIAAINGCPPLFQAALDAHADFDNSFKAYEKDRMLEASYSNGTTLRNELLRIFNGNIVPYFTVMANLNNETFGELDLHLTQIVDDYNARIKRRLEINNEED